MTLCRCKLCDAEAFENNRLYVRHMRESHADETDIFNCVKCSSKSFERFSSFKHEEIYSSDEQRQVIACPHCPKKFNCPWNANKHVRALHKEKDMTIRVICDQCGKLLLRKCLKKHLGTHSTKKKCCSLCDLQFSSSSKLRRHMAVHSP